MQRPFYFMEGCAHDSPDCTAWRGEGDLYTELRPSADGTMLVYLTTSGWRHGAETPLDGPYDALCVSDLDGSNKRALVTLNSVSSGAGYQSMWQVFYDGEAIYYTVHESQGDGTNTHVFRKTDVATGETKELHRWNSDWLYFTAAPIGDYVIIEEHDISSNEGGKRYTAINVKDGKASEFDLSNVLAKGERLAINTVRRDGFCLVYDNEHEPTKLYRCNILTGERELVFEKPDDWVSPNGRPADWGGEVLGGRLVISYVNYAPLSVDSPPAPARRYVLNEATGELEPLTLAYYEGYEKLVQVRAETDDSFLVVNSERVIQGSYYDNDGRIFNYEDFYPNYAMISKEDFFNSIPNYREITEASQ